MLRIRSEKRHKCEDIVRKLDALCNKCEDEVYCSKSSPCVRKKKRNDSDPPQPYDIDTIQMAD
ncbi:uncharacterized protein F4807DRAFT_407141 [Annulohypoxylon truncatum]|uniref:uncharacterized protein n=1 Tax=Annulohypoxylon truncatum TaxID=327061 RepID=UPI002007996A|nr:uncharacterized protein F4807DRAFT_407141 [Annulohypoxylon truncatum]KAI1214233.1 hypothetical protein F4807DRAFT_407141 [Annulohypoxylon truncatum]